MEQGESLPEGLKMGDDEMEIIDQGDQEEERLEKFHQEYPVGKEPFTPEHMLTMLDGKLFTDILFFMEDGEHEKKLEEFFGEKEWQEFYRLLKTYYETPMTPANWKQSAERAKLYGFVLRVYHHPEFGKYWKLPK